MSTLRVADWPGEMWAVFLSPMPGPSTSRACVIWPSFEAENVTVPVFLTVGLDGVILNSFSDSLTLLPPLPPVAAGALCLEVLALLLLLLLSLLLPHPVTARAPAAR